MCLVLQQQVKETAKKAIKDLKDMKHEFDALAKKYKVGSVPDPHTERW